ncbi:SET domain-containing protein-lysine N-methyltransferase [Leptodesmis sp.]|uniref:SET domain-containing protein-lysine N-methyltransferase n=1 Tax=Leptodesmis sp. TaxID=3100501 RepID=UPI00405356A6
MHSFLAEPALFQYGCPTTTMIHPHTELRFINEAIGYGVFATEFIPKGTITWILDELDQRYEEAYVMALDPLLRDRLLKFCFRDEQSQYILCWDIARYVNHSFNSTLIATPYYFELAARDIYPGDEITDDDILHYYSHWDRIAAETMQHFNQVDQPLKHLIDPKFADKVAAIAAGQEVMDSLLTCYYNPGNRMLGLGIGD